MNAPFFSPEKRCYIIAELSANHNGELAAALELVRLAAEAGADAVKIQTYTADSLTIDCNTDYFRIGGGTLWDGKTLYNLYEEAYTPREWHAAIFAEARAHGIDCFSTPFDEDAVDFLEGFNPPCHKVASFELPHLPLLRKIAATHRPVILSTGMASVEEIEEAVNELRVHGCPEIALLKCTSAYPAPVEEANLRRIPEMAERFGVVAGLSDHTPGLVAPVTAVALGARVIEKHLCRSRQEPGPDSAFSMEPQEFKDMVAAVRAAEAALGQATYERSRAEQGSLKFRRSLFFVRDLEAGQVISDKDVSVIRPGHGLHPRYLGSIIGRRTTRAIERGTPVSWDAVDGQPA